MRLHVVDGTLELFRAHFSKRPGHTSPGGQDLKATVGVVSSLLALLHQESEAVTHLAVAFDNPIRSFRNDLFDGYKTDDGVPPELLAQFDAVEHAVRCLGVTVWSMKEFETDDALAAAAARYADEVGQVRLLTSDKDLLQCIRDRRVVMVDRQRERELDEEAVRATRGVAPSQIPDLLGLIGDDADGIPGLPGFGEKTTAALLSAFGRIEDIPLDPAKWPSGVRGAERLSGTLRERREDALLYRTLATLRTDAPIGKSLQELAFEGVPREPFLTWCDEAGVNSLRTRPRRWRDSTT
ncbi:MAG: 5'-3' exonuclease H3TH domain-containing protein [Myxococcaceae bacterium]